MHRIFGTGKGQGSSSKKDEDEEPAKPKPTLGDAARSMDDRAKGLDQKIKAIDQELLRYKDQLKRAAPASKAGIQKRALATLQRKKMYEKQRDSIVGQAFNIEQTAFAIETMQDTQIAIEAMKDATKTLQVEQTKINLDEIEDMQDDLFDMFEEQEDIQDILSRNYETPDGVDEDDLDAELAGLEDVFDGIELDNAIDNNNTTSISMPDQPTTVFTGGVQVPQQHQAETLPPKREGNTIGMM
jgi:charged multivesicular body protein 5